MLNLLLCAGLAVSLLGSRVTARNVHQLPRQLSGGQYINDTQFGNVSTSVQLDISINGGGRNKTAPLLYGWMFEDISVGQYFLSRDLTNQRVAFRRWWHFMPKCLSTGLFKGQGPWSVLSPAYRVVVYKARRTQYCPLGLSVLVGGPSAMSA
jgi:hypothetical protein